MKQKVARDLMGFLKLLTPNSDIIKVDFTFRTGGSIVHYTEDVESSIENKKEKSLTPPVKK